MSDATTAWERNDAPSTSCSRCPKLNTINKRFGPWDDTEVLSRNEYFAMGQTRFHALLSKRQNPSSDKTVVTEHGAPYTVVKNPAVFSFANGHYPNLPHYWVNIFSSLELDPAMSLKQVEVTVPTSDHDTKTVLECFISVPAASLPAGVLIVTNADFSDRKVQDVFEEANKHPSDLIREMISEARGVGSSIQDIRWLFQDYVLNAGTESMIDNAINAFVVRNAQGKLVYDNSRSTGRQLMLKFFGNDRNEVGWALTLLGTRNGKMYARLLEDFSDAFGRQLIKYVMVWKITVEDEIDESGYYVKKVLAFSLQ